MRVSHCTLATLTTLSLFSHYTHCTLDILTTLSLYSHFTPTTRPLYSQLPKRSSAVTSGVRSRTSHRNARWWAHLITAEALPPIDGPQIRVGLPVTRPVSSAVKRARCSGSNATPPLKSPQGRAAVPNKARPGPRLVSSGETTCLAGVTNLRVSH